MDNFKYIKNVSEGVGTILIYNQIGDSVDSKGNYQYGISGSSFANEMLWLSNNCTSIDVRINSVGGSVFDGYSIISAILNSPIPVNTYVDGLAASIAGVIAVSGKKCHIMDYGTLMMHNPSGGEDKVLELIKDTLVTILSNRCKKSKEEISAMMEKETWLNAQEALEGGFADSIVSSGKKLKVNKTESLYNMAIIYNQLIEKNMDNNQDNVQAIDELKAALASAEAVNNELKSKIEQFENEKTAREEAEKTALKNKAELLVNNAVKEGKLKSDESAKTLELASKDEANFEFVSNMIAKVGTGKEAVKVFNSANVKNSNDERTNWTYNDWEKKDSEGLVNMYVNNRAEYELLLTTYKIK